MLTGGELTLVRIYEPAASGRLCFECRVPTEDTYRPETVDTLLKRKRAGASLKATVDESLPNVAEKVTEDTTPSEIRELVMNYVKSLPPEDCEVIDRPILTGTDASITPLLPEVIYIPAVKDLAADMKPSSTTPFGKVVAILLDAVLDELGEEDVFADLRRKLQIQETPEGQSDNRLQVIRNAEKAVEDNLRRNFSECHIRFDIPSPEIKSSVMSTRVLVNDGVEDALETKGDGLRRAVVFSILQAYVQLKDARSTATSTHPYLLLFEEPELYLHPQAQLVLFEALSAFSSENMVVVTSHSPVFFNAGATETFVKLSKAEPDDSAGSKPSTRAVHVDLTDIAPKDQFQLICFENNNAAFFAESVVLVEGRSDALVLAHLAELHCSDYTTSRCPVRFAQMGGKTSVKKYREFFGRFDISVYAVLDLDVIVDGFEQLNMPPEVVEMRAKLLEMIDAKINLNGGPSPPSGPEVRKIKSSGSARSQYERALASFEEVDLDNPDTDQLVAVIDALSQFFDRAAKADRNAILHDPPNDEVSERLQELIGAMAAKNVFVLRHGAIEDYYPHNLVTGDKPEAARAFCESCSDLETFIAVLKEVDENASAEENEFGRIVERIFGPHVGSLHTEESVPNEVEVVPVEPLLGAVSAAPAGHLFDPIKFLRSE